MYSVLLIRSCEVMPSENVSFMPNVGKPWSTEDLAQKVTWTARSLFSPVDHQQRNENLKEMADL